MTEAQLVANRANLRWATSPRLIRSRVETGRFKDASGTLTLTATSHPVLFSDSNAAVLLTSTGQFTGTISSAATEEESQDERQ